VNPLEAFGIVAGVASIVGIVLTIRYARKTVSRVKDLRYNASISRYSIFSRRALREYGVSISYGSGKGSETIDSLYVSQLTIANLGDESIRRTDIAPSNPLRVEVKGVHPLDISLVAATRNVINFAVGQMRHPVEGSVVADVTFDYLDGGDGGLVRVLSTKPVSSITLKGDIIGMPSGIRAADEVGQSTVMGRIGVAASLVLFLTSLSVTPLLYKWVTGGWEYVWILALPVLALILPLAIIAIVGTTLWPSPRPLFPEKIRPRRSGRLRPIMTRDGEQLIVRAGSDYLLLEDAFDQSPSDKRSSLLDEQTIQAHADLVTQHDYVAIPRRTTFGTAGCSPQGT
jgi:hypothetical protein